MLTSPQRSTISALWVTCVAAIAKAETRSEKLGAARSAGPGAPGGLVAPLGLQMGSFPRRLCEFSKTGGAGQSIGAP